MSTYSDDYRELIDDARDAVEKLLRGSTPDSWIGVRASYSVLRLALERDDLERQLEQKRHAKDEQEERSRRVDAEMRQHRDVWTPIRRERRESLLFQVLGDEGLTIRELTSRLGAELGVRIYENNARSLVMAMFRAGQLERIGESFMNKTRYRYFRKRGLDGPIVDLEQAYHHDDEAGDES